MKKRGCPICRTPSSAFFPRRIVCCARAVGRGVLLQRMRFGLNAEVDHLFVRSVAQAPHAQRGYPYYAALADRGKGICRLRFGSATPRCRPCRPTPIYNPAIALPRTAPGELLPQRGIALQAGLPPQFVRGNSSFSEFFGVRALCGRCAKPASCKTPAAGRANSAAGRSGRGLCAACGGRCGCS